MAVPEVPCGDGCVGSCASVIMDGCGCVSDVIVSGSGGFGWFAQVERVDECGAVQ